MALKHFKLKAVKLFSLKTRLRFSCFLVICFIINFEFKPPSSGVNLLNLEHPALKRVPFPAMVKVKGGIFDMGDVMDDKQIYTEETVHSVKVDNFWIAVHELTFEEYDAYCEATKQKKADDSKWGRGKHPVINVSWNNAIAYCNWLSEQHGFQQVYSIKNDTVTANWEAKGYRLPTEAEWEYAAREGGKKIRFGNGKDTADAREINFDPSPRGLKPYSKVGQFRGRTVPVGSLNSPNAFGLHDMSGNVFEFCWDYSDGYYNNPENNPHGPDQGFERSMRGGCWNITAAGVRNAVRGNRDTDHISYYIGFRLARSE